MTNGSRGKGGLIKAGQLDFLQQFARDPAPITRAQEKLITSGKAISQSPPSSAEMAYLHSVLCQVGLPRSAVGEREFMRRSGRAWLNVQAGFLDEGSGPVEQPIPYGALPRLALAWVSTFAKQHKTREIRIGDSAAEFLRLMGVGDDGKRYAALRKQMHALAACRLQMGCSGETFSGEPIERFRVWVANKDHQRALWPGVLVLSHGYYDSLLTAAVPLDNRAMIALKGSALALDIYVWLAHRLRRTPGKIVINWESLREQFGDEYADLRSFKQEFLRLLKRVLKQYPRAQVRPVSEGLLLQESPPPVPYKGSV